MGELEERRKLWTDALSSGEYVQGRGRLRDGDRFCCLGVLCDIYSREAGTGEWIDDRFLLDGNRYMDFLPDAVREWIGLNSREGSYGGSTLALNNDNGATFAEIGGIIASNPEGLFHE